MDASARSVGQGRRARASRCQGGARRPRPVGPGAGRPARWPGPASRPVDAGTAQAPAASAA